MADFHNEPNFSFNFERFKSVNDKETEQLLPKRNARNTNDATKVWINCLKDYLIEKNKLQLHEICNDDLPKVL